jgi:hypothetical protein
MKNLLRIRIIKVSVLVSLVFILVFPPSVSALRPLNEEDLSKNSPSLSDHDGETRLTPVDETNLDKLSPSLVAPDRKKTRSSVSPESLEFEKSICFKRCHHSGSLQASDKTAKQWQLLIERNGHSIFSEIPWQTPDQKRKIVDYLLNNARDSKPESSGIGVW